MGPNGFQVHGFHPFLATHPSDQPNLFDIGVFGGPTGQVDGIENRQCRGLDVHRTRLIDLTHHKDGRIHGVGDIDDIVIGQTNIYPHVRFLKELQQIHPDDLVPPANNIALGEKNTFVLRGKTAGQGKRFKERNAAVKMDYARIIHPAQNKYLVVFVFGDTHRHQRLFIILEVEFLDGLCRFGPALPADLEHPDHGQRNEPMGAHHMFPCKIRAFPDADLQRVPRTNEIFLVQVGIVNLQKFRRYIRDL